MPDMRIAYDHMPCMAKIYANPANATMDKHAARPSMPSIRLTALQACRQAVDAVDKIDGVVDEHYRKNRERQPHGIGNAVYAHEAVEVV